VIGPTLLFAVGFATPVAALVCADDGLIAPGVVPRSPLGVADEDELEDIVE
jgi:hypothetical protein